MRSIPATQTQDSRNPHWTRRQLISTLASASCAGQSWLCGLAHASAASQSTPPKSVIMIWLEGGPSTIDLWDLKPHHANGGLFRPTSTNVPGVQICEHLPELARLADEFTLIRSMTSPEGDHQRALHLLRTGYQPQGAIQFPAFGSIVAGEIGRPMTKLPPFVSITPTQRIKEVGNGFLSANLAPFEVTQGEKAGTLSVPGLKSMDATEEHLRSTHVELLEKLDQRFLGTSSSSSAARLRTSRRQAQQMLTPQVAGVFDLSKESHRHQTNYGNHRFGQSCLLARRLIETDVPFVELTLSGWDTHRNNFPTVRQLASQLDQGTAALIRDLRERGRLDSTLIICHGEFGRTPHINGNGGRDHFPNAWGLMLAGGGLPHGQVIGATTDDGTEIADSPIAIPDLIATVCHHLGIDHHKQQMSNVRRPIRVADLSAQPIAELL